MSHSIARFHFIPNLAAAISLMVGMASLVACTRTLSPPGESEERQKIMAAGQPFAVTVDKRPLPDLSTLVTLGSALEYAFNANGDIEGAYREWRAGIEKVPQVGTLPDPKLSFSFLFNATNLKSFADILDKITLMYSQDLPAAGKRLARTEQALALAQSTGEKFRGEKYRLQNRVIATYAALLLNAEMLKLNDEAHQLQKEIFDVSVHRFHAMTGETQVDIGKIETEIRVNESEKRQLVIERKKLEGEFNGVLNRPVDGPVGKIAISDIILPTDQPAELFSRAVAHNTELASMRAEIKARGAGEVLAELERKPDFGLNGGLETKFSPFALMPSLGADITLPIGRARIRAGIDEALAMRQGAEARLRAKSSDVQARVVTALALYEDANRILNDYSQKIIPEARRIIETQETAYGSGGGDILDILDTERTLIDYRKLVASAQEQRLRALGELEEVVGEDLFSFLPKE